MTWIIGLKHNNISYLVGDTLVTGFRASGPVDSVNTTSFGEVNQNGKYFTNETMLKLFVINNLTIAVAGNVDKLNYVLNDIKIYIGSGFSYKDAIKMAISNHEPFYGVNSISLIFSFYENGIVKLLAYDSKVGHEFLEITNENEFFQFGSVENTTMEMLQTIFQDVLELSEDPKIILVTLTVILQLLSINLNLIDQNAGGTFVGVLNSEFATEWVGDTLHVLFRDNMYFPIGIFYENNSVLVNSNINRQKTLLFNSVSTFPKDLELNRWIQIFSEKYRFPNYSFICLYNEGFNKCALLFHESFEKYLHLTVTNNDEPYYEMLINPDVLQWLEENNDQTIEIKLFS